MPKVHTFVVLAYKESKDLERCIESVLNQKYKSEVLIATSTPNDFINNVAKKYKLKIKVNKESKHRIGDDFDFGIKCADTELVTVAHQDDIYDYEYSDRVVKAYNEFNDSIIIFTDYYEIKNNKKIYSNRNLRIKRILLRTLRNKKKSYMLWRKKHVIKYGNAISCPSVTYVKNKIKFPLFDCDLKCNIDWNGWEKLYKETGYFIFIRECLMGHTISNETTTTKIINEGIRTKEDYIMFRRFWPSFISKILTKLYKFSERNNEIK